jgi:hypothetical protein
MPISLRPNKEFPIYLDSDMETPVEQRPVFYALTKCIDDHETLCERYDNSPVKSIVEMNKLHIELLTENIVRWENIPAEFEFPDFRKLLTIAEARELIRKVIANAYLTPEEKKS